MNSSKNLRFLKDVLPKAIENVSNLGRDIYYAFSPLPPILRLIFCVGRKTLREILEFITQKDAFLWPFFPVFM